MKTVSIALPDQWVEEFAAFAAEEGTTLEELLIAGLGDFLAQLEENDERLDEARAQLARSEGVDTSTAHDIEVRQLARYRVSDADLAPYIEQVEADLAARRGQSPALA